MELLINDKLAYRLQLRCNILHKRAGEVLDNDAAQNISSNVRTLYKCRYRFPGVVEDNHGCKTAPPWYRTPKPAVTIQ